MGKATVERGRGDRGRTPDGAGKRLIARRLAATALIKLSTKLAAQEHRGKVPRPGPAPAPIGTVPTIATIPPDRESCASRRGERNAARGLAGGEGPKRGRGRVADEPRERGTGLTECPSRTPTAGAMDL